SQSTPGPARVELSPPFGVRVKRIGGSLPTAPTLGLAPPGNEIPPLRGRQKPLQDPTPVERARTVTRMAGVLNHAPNDRALSQDLRNPQIREAGFRLSTSTDTASRPSARAPRGPSFLTELEKSIRTILTYFSLR